MRKLAGACKIQRLFNTSFCMMRSPHGVTELFALLLARMAQRTAAGDGTNQPAMSGRLCQRKGEQGHEQRGRINEVAALPPVQKPVGSRRARRAGGPGAPDNCTSVGLRGSCRRGPTAGAEL